MRVRWSHVQRNQWGRVQQDWEDSLCAMAMTPDRGMMRFCVCWWLWWELWMLVSVLTGGRPPPEPEIWVKRRTRSLERKYSFDVLYSNAPLAFKRARFQSVKQMLAVKHTMGINVDFAQILFVKRCTCVTTLIHEQTGIRGGKNAGA